MKKYLIGLLAVLLMPISVNAMAYSETFNVGDRVKVMIENDDEGAEFFVIKPSESGAQYVWMFLNGNVMDQDGNSITVYDETIPGEREASAVFEDSMAYRLLHNATQKWRTEEVRLLQLADLTELGIEKNPTNNQYQIMGNRKYLSPIKLTQGYPGMANPKSAYNFWTQIEDTTKTNASVFAVTLNEDYNGDTLTPVAFLTSYDITSITDNPEFVIRPVIKIDKKYIDCLLDVPTTVSSPPTSEVKMPFEAISVIVIAGAAYLLIRKKEIFNKI